MSIFLANSKQPLRLQVAERIKQMIARDYGPGDVLPTYMELTRRFGVGLVTVKRAMDILAAKGIVSPIRRKGTIVNRRLQPGETRLRQIGLVIRTTINRLFQARYLAEMCGSLSLRIDDLESNLRIFSLHRASGPIRPHEVVVTGVDGALLLGVFDKPYIAEFARQDIPLVVLDHHCEDIPLDYVACDNAGAVAAVVEHLGRLGHRRIAYVDVYRPGPFEPADCEQALQEESDRVERREGFIEAVKTFLPGAAAPVHTFTAPQAGGRGPSLADFVAGLRPGAEAPTALVTKDEICAAELIAHLAERHLRVPEDLSVAAVAGPDLLAAETPHLTYCQMDFWDMGKQAMKLLELRSRTPRPTEANVVRVGFKFVRGKTSAAPAGGT